MIFEIYQCIVIEHDYRLVILAAMISLFASYTTMSLLQRAKEAEESARKHWGLLTAISAGSGVWATHFVAMIAYDPGMPVAFDVILTVLSVLVAIVVCGAGFAIWVLFRGILPLIIAGTVVGSGIASMHWVGMDAVRLQGTIHYDQPYLLLAVFLGVGFSSLTLYAMKSFNRQRYLLRGSFLFMAAICTLHFTAMTAVNVTYDPTVSVPTYAVPKVYIVLGVTLAAGLLLALTLASALIDRHMAKRFQEEARYLRDIVDAGTEGIVLLDDKGRILAANGPFLRLVGRRHQVIQGLMFKHCFRNLELDEDLLEAAEDSIERQAVAIHADGSERSVQVALNLQHGLAATSIVALVTAAT
ncbi:MHYT domain-containing protein [Kordiimonas lacus]|uniref:PAS domain S-box-containing protein n=1 Tax=Kordiimonas lacus TaxID=637679 RepID=A0A1G6Y424_9PROT|nr:MHYT domain-containing protein [Kordiimonas lacus]SDD84356.1 PAS domain S-box-containing protein [Kordiimonas lacus]